MREKHLCRHWSHLDEPLFGSTVFLFLTRTTRLGWLLLHTNIHDFYKNDFFSKCFDRELSPEVWSFAKWTRQSFPMVHLSGRETLSSEEEGAAQYSEDSISRPGSSPSFTEANGPQHPSYSRCSKESRRENRSAETPHHGCRSMQLRRGHCYFWENRQEESRGNGHCCFAVPAWYRCWSYGCNWLDSSGFWPSYNFMVQWTLRDDRSARQWRSRNAIGSWILGLELDGATTRHFELRSTVSTIFAVCAIFAVEWQRNWSYPRTLKPHSCLPFTLYYPLQCANGQFGNTPVHFSSEEKARKASS